MTTAAPPFRSIYRKLLAAWGPQHWWPARNALEMIVGAILTQNTAWGNVEKAIARLHRAGALRARRLHEAPLSKLAAWIRPAGYYRVKAARLRAFTTMLQRRHGGRLSRLFRRDTAALREELLAVNGIGPETADSILLYAARRPVFVVDAYTRRCLERHGWIRVGAAYDEIAACFTDCLPRDVALYNEFHALVVRLGKTFCRTQPRCAACPLNAWPRRETAGSRGRCPPARRGHTRGKLAL